LITRPPHEKMSRSLLFIHGSFLPRPLLLSSASSHLCPIRNPSPAPHASPRRLSMSVGPDGAPGSTFASRLSLLGRTALVTGGTSGIGEAIALNLGECGADVVAMSRGSEDAAEIEERFRAMGRRFWFVECDLADAEKTREAAEKAMELAPVIDILVNNAGVALLDPVGSLSNAKWDKTMEINVRAPFVLAKALAPKMIAQKYGKIINITSVAGLYALEDHAAYCTSKAALNMLTKIMALEWGKYNVTANAIAPTVIMTKMGKEVWGPPEKSGPMLARIPLGRFGEPIEVADMVAFLASPAAGLINGQVIALDGGYSAI